MDANDARVEAALASYPVSPLPPGFKRRVTSEIARYETRFSLDFLDYALPAFLWLFCSISLLLMAWMLNTLDPLWYVNVQRGIQILQIRFNGLAYWPAVVFSVFGVTAIVLSSLIAYFVMSPKRMELR